MEGFADNILPALGLIADPVNLALIVVGVVAGVVFGVLPGFGGSQALALLFPFTFAMEPASAIMFMVSVYSGAEYGGSIPAILIRTPGTTAAIMTVLDGAPMAKQGRPRRALMISVISGVSGGLISSLIFIVAATGLAWVGLQFGPPELFAVGVFGLAIIGSFVGKDPTKTFIGAAIGLLLATIGSSQFSGMRFVFDQPWLYDGIPLIVMIIAMLAAPEAFKLMLHRQEPEKADDKAAESDGDDVVALAARPDDRFGFGDFRKLIPTILRGSLFGTAIGALPGPGPTVAAVIAYNEEKRWSKTPEKFGTGIDEGIAAPESSNNAVVAGAMVPALALGIPGSGAIAVLLGVLISKGIVPGPTLFSEGGPLVLAIFLGLIACNIVLLAVGTLGVRAFVPLAKLPASVLGPFILALLVIGTYAFDNSIVHVLMFFVLGAFAYLLERFGISALPVILGFVMGPIIEVNLNRGLIIEGGDIWAIVSRPITAGLLIVAIATAILSYRRSMSALKE
jgi:putative tricarboxylic transport membrane protein